MQELIVVGLAIGFLVVIVLLAAIYRVLLQMEAMVDYLGELVGELVATQKRLPRAHSGEEDER